MRSSLITFGIVVMLLLGALTHGHTITPVNQGVVQSPTKPAPAPARWRPLIGEYVLDNETLFILENDGKLSALFKKTELAPMRELSKNEFEFAESTSRAGTR